MVKDSSGAVLPGVTVEASSDVLIEKVRTVVTDGAGLYNIQNLRPGTYVVTFTLTGFQTYKREGLELPGGFTATVDATMKVGSLEESVTVSGASPVVDVSSNVKSQVLPRDVLDSVPNAHTIQSVGQLIPGVTLTSPDVGGSVQMQQTYFSVHGFGASGTTVMMDGMVINSLQGDGAIQSYFTTAGSQEMVYQTGGGGGDSPSGGLVINMVPREGGNRFAGTSSLGLENWQSNNFGQELKDVGVTSVDKLGTYHDFDITEGGPIIKDKIWFFAVGRLSREVKPVANSTNVAQLPGWQGTASLTNPAQSAALLATCRAEFAAGTGCAQGESPETINSALGRLTMQVTSKTKLQLYQDRVHKIREAAQGANDDQAVTSVFWNSPNYSTSAAKLTATLTNRLLLEGGFSETIERYNNLYQPGLEQPYYTPLWYQLASRRNVSDASSSIAPGTESHQYPDRYNLQGSTSYVTGTHNVKVGVLYSTGVFNRGYYKNGDILQQYLNIGGVPTGYQATIYPTDNRYADQLNYVGDLYAQDSWTHKRLTLTGGIRYDFLQEAAKGFPAQQGTFEVIPAFNTINLPKQTDWSPRVSAVYDLFGNGKTAIRAGYAHIVATATDSLAESVNPAGNITNSTTATIPWKDLNGDNVVQYTVSPSPNGGLASYCTYGQLGCELDFSKVPAGFGAIGVTTKLDPNLRRPTYNQMNLGISHEVFKGVSTSLEWYRTMGNDIAYTENQSRIVDGLTDPSKNPNYTQFTVFSPITGDPIPMYDVTAAALATRASTFTTTLASLKTTYDGFDWGVNARLHGGGRLFGGTTTERTLANNCGQAIDNPSNILYCDTSSLEFGQSIPWKTLIKASITYPLPWWGLIANGSYQGLPGYTLTATTYTVNKSTKYTVCPGNSAAAGCVVGAFINPNLVSSSVSVPLDAPGTELTPRTNQVDLGIEKRLTFGRLRFDPKIDLFNALNSDDYYSVVSTVFNPIVGPSGVNAPAIPANAAGTQYPSYHQPGRFLQGRIVKIGFNASW